MNPDSRKAKAIFDRAIEIESPSDREAFVLRECAEDPGLRAKVLGLLGAYDQAGSFLESAPFGILTVAPVDQPPGVALGTLVGPYKLLEPIGEGGMGTVYLAEQMVPVKRMVALKVIKAGMDSRQVLARFEAERQALALMDHPNIARVLDAGATESGRPYFVMELVKGVPITRFCDEKHLTPRERMELFIPVCQAVQHAHQKGIIHRDLKPTNVLVGLYDGKPMPKIIDFGVAKAAGPKLTEATLFTGFGTVIGTPEYMSPEQAQLDNLDIDTRSDIYSLGVLLYELLTGTTPFIKKDLEEAGLLEMLRVIREQEPTKPSTKLSTAEGLPTLAANRGTEPAKLTKLVRGELDWIVLKCLEKDRNRRYETANALTRDIEHYLHDEPVAAGPPSAVYRFRKFARRNKAALAVAALVLFFLMFFAIGIGWAVRERGAREAKVSGQVELIMAEVDRLERQQKWPEALAMAKRAEAALQSGQADTPTTQRVRALLKDLEFLDRLEQIRMQGADSGYQEIHRHGADQEYARAFRDYGVDIEELPIETSIERLKARPTLAIPLAAALDGWREARQRSSTDGDGWQRLAAVARGIDPDPLRAGARASWGQPASEVEEELRRLADSIDIRAQHPATLDTLARTLWQTKHSDSALRLLRDARHVYPGDFWLNFDLALALSKRKDHEGAIRFYTAAESIRPNCASVHNNLGIALVDQRKLDAAVACFRRAIELDPKLAMAHNNLGNALRDQKKLDEAVAACRKAIELDPKDALFHINLGYALYDQKKPDEAIAVFRKAIRLFESKPQSAEDVYPHSVALQMLGYALYRVGAWPESIEVLEKSWKLQPGGTGDSGQWIVISLAHWKLSDEEERPEPERSRHKEEARRWFERADKEIDSWGPRPRDYMAQAIWDFREEARKLMGANGDKK